MRVLAINQFFWPDTAATAQLLADVIRGMDPNVNTVSVLCGATFANSNLFVQPICFS
jgi:hypothetical protein